MPHDPQRYFRQVQEARAVGLRMTGASLEGFNRILEEYAERLARAIGRAADPAQLLTDRRFLATLDRILDELALDMATATRNSITFTVRRVSEIHAQATAEMLAAEGIAAIGVSGTGVATRVLQGYLARPELAEAFRTIAPNSRQAVNGILRRAAVEGISGPQLALQLRTHILGADAIPDRFLLDRRRIGYEALRQMGLEPTRENLLATRKMAGQLSGKANLIARTEPMNAQHEARVQATIESPVVQALEWHLSSAHPKPDFCDTLADEDLFGMGPGRYDPRACPPRPHPRCLCFTIDILLPVDKWGQPRGPVPKLQTTTEDIVELYGFTPSEERQIAAVLKTATTHRPPGRQAA